MARPYSMDLRERVVAAVGGGMSCRRVAQLFNVSASTAINWAKRVRELGSVAPGPMCDHKPRRIAGAHRAWLAEQCRTHAFTLRRLVVDWRRAA